VETSLLRSGAHLMNYFYTEYWLDGTVHKRMGSANHLTVPNQAFPAIDGSVIIIAAADDMWRRLTIALDPERLDRPEFRTAFDRRSNRDALIPALTEVNQPDDVPRVDDQAGCGEGECLQGQRRRRRGG